MPNLEFNLDQWLSIFSIETLRKTMPYEVYGRQITSPVHLAIVEQLRREIPASDLGRKIPTDVFVFGKGESPSRECTKIGGLPYRPADLSWPLAHDDGQPMTFVGQWNFTNSKDITRPLPGDVLLVFSKNDVPVLEGTDALRFEWYMEGLTDLVRPDMIPKPAWRFVICHGYRWRIADLPDAQFQFDEYESSWKIPILEGTKIGGIPPFFEQIEENGGMPGRFLASIGSIQPILNCPYPWTNIASPLIMKNAKCLFCEEEEELMWGDAGVLMLFIDDDNIIHWTIECY